MISEPRHHMGHKDDSVGFLYVSPELQQSRHHEWMIWLQEDP